MLHPPSNYNMEVKKPTPPLPSSLQDKQVISGNLIDPGMAVFDSKHYRVSPRK